MCFSSISDFRVSITSSLHYHNIDTYRSSCSPDRPHTARVVLPYAQCTLPPHAQNTNICSVSNNSHALHKCWAKSIRSSVSAKNCACVCASMCMHMGTCMNEHMHALGWGLHYQMHVDGWMDVHCTSYIVMGCCSAYNAVVQSMQYSALNCVFGP